MDTDLIASLAAVGVALGIVEGIKPGPLLTMVIRESLTKGLKAGMWTAAAPIFTDGPMIIATLLVAGWMAPQPMVLFIISLLGAVFLTKMGVDCFGLEPPSAELGDDDASGSFKRGILTNLLNPNVYMFWVLIGGPLMASAAEEEPFAPITFALCFLIDSLALRGGRGPVVNTGLPHRPVDLRPRHARFRSRLRLPSVRALPRGLLTRGCSDHPLGVLPRSRCRAVRGQSSSSRRFLSPLRCCAPDRTRAYRTGRSRCR